MWTLLTIALCLAFPVAWGLLVGFVFDRLVARKSDTPVEPPEYSI